MTAETAGADDGVTRSDSRPSDSSYGASHTLQRKLMLLGALASLVLFYLIHVGVSVELLRVPVTVVAGVGIAVGVFGIVQTLVGYAR